MRSERRRAGILAMMLCVLAVIVAGFPDAAHAFGKRIAVRVPQQTAQVHVQYQVAAPRVAAFGSQGTARCEVCGRLIDVATGLHIDGGGNVHQQQAVRYAAPQPCPCGRPDCNCGQVQQVQAQVQVQAQPPAGWTVGAGTGTLEPKPIVGDEWKPEGMPSPDPQPTPQPAPMPQPPVNVNTGGGTVSGYAYSYRVAAPSATVLPSGRQTVYVDLNGDGWADKAGKVRR